jgi:hypothetical protein
MTAFLTKFRSKFEKFVKKLFADSLSDSQKFSAHKVEAVRPAHLAPDCQVSQHEFDAFRMKAIVLLKKDAMFGASLQMLLKNPVQVNIAKEENQKVVIKLSQAFEWSGRVYQLEGEFLRDPHKKMHSIPLSKTFKITQSLIQ